MATPTSVLESRPATEATQELRTFALRFRQKRPDVNLYVTALPLRALLGRFRADNHSTVNPAGYQRPVTPSRLPPPPPPAPRLHAPGGGDAPPLHPPLRPAPPPGLLRAGGPIGSVRRA